jgi:hypothetical protein
MVKLYNWVATHILVIWKGLSPSETTWEFINDFVFRSPEFPLEDKGTVMEGTLLQFNINEMKEELGIRAHCIWIRWPLTILSGVMWNAEFKLVLESRKHIVLFV